MVRPQDGRRHRKRSVEGMAMISFLCIIKATNTNRVTCKNKQENKSALESTTEGSHTCMDVLKKPKISDNLQKLEISHFL